MPSRDVGDTASADNSATPPSAPWQRCRSPDSATTRPSRKVKVRVEESTRALDALHQLNEGQAKNELPSTFDLQQLCGALDHSHPVMSGHSFGGVTVITTLAKDKRFKIGVSLDPWMFPIKDEVRDVCGSVSQPLICISTEGFQVDANLQCMTSLPSESTTFVTIKGTVHQNQSDTPFLVGNIGRVIMGSNSSLDAHTAMDINNRLMLNFIARHLGDRAASMNNYAHYLEVQQQNMVYGLYGKCKSRWPVNSTSTTSTRTPEPVSTQPGTISQPVTVSTSNHLNQ